MILAARITAVTLVSLLILSFAAGYFLVRNVQLEFELQQQETAERISKALNILLVDQWRTSGRAGVVRTLREGGPASSLGLDVKFVSIDETLPWQRATSTTTNRSLIDVDANGQRRLHTYVPLVFDGISVGGLEYSGSLEPMERQTQGIMLISLAYIAAFGIASIIASYIVGIRWIGKPLKALIEKSERVGRGDFTEPLRLAQHDELGRLAQAINQMCERLTQQRESIQSESAARLTAVDQLRHADRLKTVGQLAAGVAHELGTPLNVIAGRAALITSGKLQDSQIQESARDIKYEADHITEIVRQLLAFARQHRPHLAKRDLCEIAKETIRLLETFAESKQVQLAFNLPPYPLWVNIDAGQIQQVITNIVMNAIQSMKGPGGLITISSCSDMPSVHSNEICLSVSDNGVGMSPEVLKQVFDPFFTTKQVGEGTGLGLSIALGIVQEHGGRIEVDSQPDEGSTFRIWLPVSRDLDSVETVN